MNYCVPPEEVFLTQKVNLSKLNILMLIAIAFCEKQFVVKYKYSLS